MNGSSGGLLAVITGSIVMVATAYLAIHYASAGGQIAKSGLQGLGTIANSWQTTKQ